MFTDEFLDMDLDIKVKEYYMDIQPYLYGKETGIGRTTLSNTKLSELTGISVPTIRKYNAMLIEKGLLEEEVTQKTDEAGLVVVQKNFNLTGLQQAALWIKAVNEQLVSNTQQLQDHSEELQEQRTEIAELKRKIAALEKEAALRREVINSSAKES